MPRPHATVTSVGRDQRARVVSDAHYALFRCRAPDRLERFAVRSHVGRVNSRNDDADIAFARGVGEYGSVIFIAGNIPYVSEIAPLLIVIKLEEFNYAGATTVAAVMLVVSFVMLLAINALQAWSNRHRSRKAAATSKEN